MSCVSCVVSRFVPESALIRLKVSVRHAFCCCVDHVLLFAREYGLYHQYQLVLSGRRQIKPFSEPMLTKIAVAKLTEITALSSDIGESLLPKNLCLDFGLQGSKFHLSDRLIWVKMTVGQEEYLQDLSDGRLHISDFHISCIGFVYFRQVNGNFVKVIFTIHLPDGQVHSIWNFEASTRGND